MLKKWRFPNILIRAFFRRVVKSLPFGSNLGQAGEWGGFAQIRGVINWGQFQAVTKEIHHFCNFYAAKTADFVVGVSGFEPEASWTRIRSGMKIVVLCVHCGLLSANFPKCQTIVSIPSTRSYRILGQRLGQRNSPFRQSRNFGNF